MKSRCALHENNPVMTQRFRMLHRQGNYNAAIERSSTARMQSG